MKLKRLDKSYKEQVINIYRHCFGYDFDEEETDFYFNQDETWKYIYGWIDEKRLVSTYTSYDFEVKIRGKKFNGHYLDGVATLPGYRNRGLVSKVMNEDIKRCQQKGIPVLMLDPFKHSYYRKFGFEVVMERRKLKADWELLKRDLDRELSGFKVEVDYLKGCRDTLKEGYREVKKWLWENSPYNEYRMPAASEEQKFYRKKKMLAVAFSSGEKPAGYLIYSIKDKKITIDHFRYINLEAFYALKKYLLSYQDQVNLVEFEKIPVDFPVELLINDYWRAGKTVDIKSHLSRMMRIIDAHFLLNELMENRPEKDINLEIVDKLIPENSGVYHISKDSVVKKDQKESKEMKINIGDLGTLLTGRKSATELYLKGKLRVPDKKQILQTYDDIPFCVKNLGRIFPPRVTFNGEEW